MTQRDLQEMFDAISVRRSRQEEINARLVTLDENEDNTAEIRTLKREFEQLDRECAVVQGKIAAGQMPLSREERTAAAAIAEQVQAIVRGQSIETGMHVENNIIYLERANTVSTNVADITPDSVHDLIEPMQPRLLVDKLGVKINTNIVGTRKYPSVNNVEASIEGEITELTGKALTFTATTATPKRIGLRIPFSLLSLHQANIDLIAYAFRLITQASAQLINKWMFATTQLSGASKGCFVDAAASPKFTLTTVDLSESDIIDLETAVLSENFENDGTAAYVCSPAAYGELKKMRDVSSGEKIMQGGMLNGYPVLVSNHIGHDADTGVKGLGFGIFSNAEINQYGAPQIVVDNLSQSSKGLVDINYNAFFDVEVVRPKAFVYGTFKTAQKSAAVVINTTTAS